MVCLLCLSYRCESFFLDCHENFMSSSQLEDLVMCCVMYFLVIYFPVLFETGEYMCYPFVKTRGFSCKVNEVGQRVIAGNGTVEPSCRGANGRAIFDGPLSLCLLSGGEEAKGDLGWTLNTKENRATQGALWTCEGQRQQGPQHKKGARGGGGAGPAPSPLRRRLQTLRDSNGGRCEQLLSGYGGPSCTCCPTEDREAVGAVIVLLRSRAAGSQS